MKQFFNHSLFLSLFLVSGCNLNSTEYIKFPYSQWTTGRSGENVTWQFETGDDLRLNNSFISRTDPGLWEKWNHSIRAYRDNARKKIGKEEPVLSCEISQTLPARIHFNKFGYDLKLIPGEIFEIEGKISLPHTLTQTLILYIDFEIKSRGEELSNVVRKRLLKIDSLQIKGSPKPVIFNKKVMVPVFQNDSFTISPVLHLVTSTIPVSMEIVISDLRLIVESSPERKLLLSRIESFINDHKKFGFSVSRNQEWMRQNYVMGFVYMWDREFWDPLQGKYNVDIYCNKMEQEFGGFQSVILWHSYPNIGIGERNQFDFFRRMPGGLDGIKKAVVDFHVNGVKVFLAYNPWDHDTRRPEKIDEKELGIILDSTWADGIFLHTWNSAAGMNSIFSRNLLFSDEFRKRNTVFISELLPEYKDLTGPHILSGSWGQQVNPFHYTDLSHLKWITPEHKQYFIDRLATDKMQMLAHAWINGQGVQVWENIFGTMNFWSVQDKQALHTMNAIWKSFGTLYLSDDWQPLIPLMNDPGIYYSRWASGNQAIWNFIDSARFERKIRVSADLYPGYRFFDLWNGSEIIPFVVNGRNYAEITVKGFGCMLATSKSPGDIQQFISDYQKMNPADLTASLAGRIKSEISLKQPRRFQYTRSRIAKKNIDLRTVTVDAGEFDLTCIHVRRDGECYPNKDALSNHDLKMISDKGIRKIVHSESLNTTGFSIMPSVVANGEFEKFLNATRYVPRYPENFLKHWNGKSCPPDLKGKPVVYVSLEDARAFAKWAGMELPSEWEWQLAAEMLNDEFHYNEVFEWNESERTDGFNRFVTLRGGCRDLKTPGSLWYLPGGPYGEATGGEQTFDSHVKYFLMYPGMDRASTIGFRCLKR